MALQSTAIVVLRDGHFNTKHGFSILNVKWCYVLKNENM